MRIEPDNGVNRKGFYVEFYEEDSVDSRLVDQKVIRASQLPLGGTQEDREKRARVIAIDYIKRELS